jgi:hypothetical protein
MNDLPIEYAAIASRLRRAIVAQGTAIERDVTAQLSRHDDLIVTRTSADSGPRLVLDISPTPVPSHSPKHRRVMAAIAAAIIVALAVVIAVQRRDSGSDTADESAPRFFLPESVPDGFELREARQGFEATNAPELWTRIYVERRSGEIHRALFISTVQGRPVGQSTVTRVTPVQRVEIAGRTADVTTSDQSISILLNDLGCGAVTIGAKGYDTDVMPPSDLVAHLATLACAPTATATRRDAAAIDVPAGFTLERDYDPIETAQQQWHLTYVHLGNQLDALGPLQLIFVASHLPLDLAECLCGEGTVVERDGRTYRTRTIDLSGASVIGTSAAASATTLTTVVWNDRGYLLTLSSTTLGVDELLAFASGVHEVPKAEFDRVAQAATSSTGGMVPTTR